MTFKKYNHTNNAFCELLTDLQSSDATMMLTGNFNRLPMSNFIVKISKYQGTKCVARENIYVANRNNNICTGLVRACEKVPMDDDATEWIQQALNFSAGDIVECIVSSEIIKDLQNNLHSVLKWSSRRILNGYSRQYWVKFWTLKGEASRLNIKIMGGAWFGANDNQTTATNEIQLTIGNNNHERNCSWHWKNDFSSSIINKVRVKKISPYEWEIYAYMNAWTHKSIIDISYSGEFIEDFRQDISVEDASGNMIYDITQYQGNGMDIGSLQEILEPTNIYDFFPFKEYSGGNKKVTLENLSKWIHRVTKIDWLTFLSMSRWNSHSVAIPNWWLISIHTDAMQDRPRNSCSLYFSTDNSNFNLVTTFSSAWGWTIILPRWFVRIDVSYDDYSEKKYVSIQAF